jgi:hypothetical protein
MPGIALALLVLAAAAVNAIVLAANFWKRSIYSE